MSTLFKFQYPTHLAMTIEWNPSLGPQVPLHLDDDDGIVADDMFDGNTMFAYEVVPAFDVQEISFSELTDTDRANFNAFQAAVTTENFEMLDVISGAWYTVHLVEFARQWQVIRESGERWAVVIKVRVVGLAP